MIDMFTNYHNLSEYYIPNNLAKYPTKVESYTKLSSNDITKPFELYNVKGELEGYFWYYKSYINLEFVIYGELILDDDSHEGSYIPAKEFIQDKIITCTLYDFRMNAIYSKTISGSELGKQPIDTTYTPVPSPQVRFDGGSSAVTEDPSNAQYDPVFNLCIDEELSKKLVKGIYYCSLEVLGPGYHEVLFSPQDCKLLVK